MGRAYYSKELSEFLTDDNSRILGELTNNHQFSLEEQQRNAWIQQIQQQKFGFNNVLNQTVLPRVFS